VMEEAPEPAMGCRQFWYSPHDVQEFDLMGCECSLRIVVVAVTSADASCEEIIRELQEPITGQEVGCVSPVRIVSMASLEDDIS